MPPLLRRKTQLRESDALKASAAPGIAETIDAMPAPRRRVMHRREARARGISPGAEAASAANEEALLEAKNRLAAQAATQRPAVDQAEEAPEDASAILQRLGQVLDPGPAVGERQAAPAANALAQAVATRQAPQAAERSMRLPLAAEPRLPHLPQGLMGAHVQPRRLKKGQGQLPALLAMLRG